VGDLDQEPIRHLVVDEASGERFEIQGPADYRLEVKPLGWEVWLHSRDGQAGILETSLTKADALRKLQRRMDEFYGYHRRTQADKEGAP
jgi:hypothetical protein